MRLGRMVAAMLGVGAIFAEPARCCSSDWDSINWCEPLTVLGLCQELQIPHRLLHYAFEKTTGMSPNKYIRAIRLNAADRIIHQDANLPKLTDLALQYGFFHSSHFGREYKKLFGRIPSKVPQLVN